MEISKTLEKWEAQCSELQKSLDEETFLKEETAEKFHQMEKKVGKAMKYLIIRNIHFQALVLKNELDNSKLKVTESERKRKIMEDELNELNESLDNLNSNNEYLTGCKIKLEKDQNQLLVRNL